MSATAEPIQLSSLWQPMWDHPEQVRFVKSNARFQVGACGARSGKTDLKIKEGVIVAGSHPLPDALIIFAAPTRDQAKNIFWEKLKQLVPKEWMIKPPMETSLSIHLVNGATIKVVGMDKPERVEGRPIDWICLDEYRDMKPEVWDKVSPMLSTRGRPPGKARFIGRPGAKTHFWELFKKAKEDTTGEWEAFHWSSEDILTKEEIESAKRRMDPLTYAREYRADWVTFEGRIYYPFDAELHASEPLKYDPSRPLIFCFDFNVDPGIAVVCQEQAYTGTKEKISHQITAVIGEVWIPKNSTTPSVCRKLIADWGHHQGEVHCYGDYTGGNRGTAQERGSNWDIIRQELMPTFGGRLLFDVRPNPGERSRINCVNTRLLSADGIAHLLIDPANAPHLIDDLEGVVMKKGTAGEIDKEPGGTLTHVSDALGYYIYLKHPIFEDTPEVVHIY